jgi:hypothetical protein
VQVLEEGIADRPGDIDVVWAYGYAWPRYAMLNSILYRILRDFALLYSVHESGGTVALYSACHLTQQLQHATCTSLLLSRIHCSFPCVSYLQLLAHVHSGCTHTTIMTSNPTAAAATATSTL